MRLQTSSIGLKNLKKVVPTQDSQTVTPSGVSVKKRIQDLIIRPAVTQTDRRGELVEIYNPPWQLHPEPMVYAYQATIRPGAIKGWVVHKKQDDRIFTCLGVQRWVFFDNRSDSETYQMINDFT